jgi:glycerol-3-phosphate acyltransferase PlsY
MAPERALPWFAVALACGYLAGSIPFGVLVARVFGLGDLRKVGSGNIGATNVLRTGNKGAAALTLLLDALKGLVPVLVFLRWGDLAGQIAGLGAFLGHCLPVWLRFRGGKGVATWFGIAFGLFWPAGAVLAAVWLGTARITRISSASALAAAAAGPVVFWALGRLEAVLAMALLGVLVWITHRGNIARLIAGTEPRIGQK